MHHNDAPNLDPRTDITDLYIFQNPGDSTRAIVILNVNPEAPTHAHAFDPQASYEFKIDTNGDFEAEVAFHVLFKSIDEGQQTATVYRATDASARSTGLVGQIIIEDARVSFTKDARITTNGEYRFYAVFGVSLSSLTRPDSSITCSGVVRIFGRVRMCLASC